MKKIVPFNNVLEFSTDVKEICAISLEHEINKDSDMISGVFNISGEYKITEGLLDKEKFDFELPFDIALGENYNMDTLLVDIDDFRYDLISDNKLKVNIDLYIDGEIEKPTPIENNRIEDLDAYESREEETELEEEQKDEIDEVIEIERIDLLKDMLTKPEEEIMEEKNINTTQEENNNTNINIFANQSEDSYATYRVYKIEENDTIDTILTKYKITKEQLADYNDIENIVPGVKLIIPTNEK